MCKANAHAKLSAWCGHHRLRVVVLRARWAVRRCGSFAARGYLVVFREAVQVGVLHREEVLERRLSDGHHDEGACKRGVQDKSR